MKMVEFRLSGKRYVGGQGGKKVLINADLIRCVIEISDETCTICYSEDKDVTVDCSYNDAVERIRSILSSSHLSEEEGSELWKRFDELLQKNKQLQDKIDTTL